MGVNMPGAYARHPGGQGTRMSRPSRSKGHVASWSGSSTEDLLNPLSLTSQQEEADGNALATSPEDVVELRHKSREHGWRFLPRRIRYAPTSIIIFEQSLILPCFVKAYLLPQARHSMHNTCSHL